MTQQVFMVCLRELASTWDHRADPYWEVGSFGCTGCHHSNLLNPSVTHIPAGARLAFSQGGPQGAKLVFLTPPVQIVRRATVLEAKWKPSMPFRYADAPLLIDEEGNTFFPPLKTFIEESRSKKWRHKLSSKCRSRAHQLPADVAAEIIRKFDAARQRATSQMLAATHGNSTAESRLPEETRAVIPYFRRSQVSTGRTISKES